MRQQIWKPILAGITIGAALYFMPFFFIRGFFFFFLIACVFRLLWFRRHSSWRHRHGYHHGYGYDPIFADAIRRMSPEEYEAFRKRNFSDRGMEGEASV